ncbi:hypothetical protein DXG01_015307 [Tephrocybe rancida]|nr:hypothetical protein DXG01_015307 [Tephrocybe rancida]
MLKQDPSDVTNALLTHILAVSLVPANTNSSIVLPSELPTFVFKPSPSAVTVNILWYLSLTCSLVAALCVILVQKWVQDYLHRIQRHSQPLRRARVRAFLYDGTKKWKMYLIVKYIPTLLHISLFLFFAGLYIFLFHINLAVSRAVAAVILLCLMFYAFATIVPLFDPSAPYETPLTAPLWRTPAQDAKALRWAHGMITSDSELQPFFESIPGFLSSSDGGQTTAHPDSSVPLRTKSPDYLEPKVQRVRASVCLEALFAISHYETRFYPNRGPGAFTMPEVLNYIEVANRCHNRSSATAGDPEGLPITSGICTLTQLDCQQFVSTYPGHLIPPNIVKVARRADKAMEDVDDMRRILEEVVLGLECDPQIDPQVYHQHITVLLQVYCAVVESKSQHLGAAVEAILPILRTQGIPTSLDLYGYLPDVCYFTAYPNIPAFSQHKIPIYIHHVLAFWRGVGAYPQLPEMQLSPPGVWFPTESISNNILEEIPLRRELEPISRLLEILELDPTTHQLQVHRQNLKAFSSTCIVRGRATEPYQKRPKVLAALLGPFSVVAHILKDIRHGVRIVTLYELVKHCKLYAPKVIESETHAIRTVLEILFPENSWLDKDSQVLFVALLRSILEWEGDPSSNPPCPFSESDVVFLVDTFKQVISHKSSLEAAKRLLGTMDLPETRRSARNHLSILRDHLYEVSRRPLEYGVTRTRMHVDCSSDSSDAK